MDISLWLSIALVVAILATVGKLCTTVASTARATPEPVTPSVSVPTQYREALSSSSLKEFTEEGMRALSACCTRMQ